MDSGFGELSLVILVAAAVAIIMRLIKQPLILGYIIAGILAGPTALHIIKSTESFEAFSKIGIVLLLFIIGLGMHVAELKKLGKVVIVAGLSSLFITTMTGFATATALGFGKTESFVIGLSLFFSSTIIIVKLLSDKKEQTRLHGQIAIGIILLEDLIATLALLFIVAGKGSSGIDISQLFLIGAKSIFLLLFLAICSFKILPKIARYMASSQELLFLFSIAWGFGIATLFEKAGFSIEIGALFAGVAMASSPFVQEIAARLRPLRDFFIVLFFISLGESMNTDNIASAIVPALLLSLIVVFLKPLIITSAAGMMGYAKRVSFKAGINLSQISEFSIVLTVLAVADGIVRPEVGSIITLVAIFTIAASTYLMQYDDKLFMYFDKIRIKFFEKDVVYHEKKSPRSYQNILIGYHHGGHEFIKTFREMKKKFLVIDYDPEVIEILENLKVDYLYGDANDAELLEEAGVSKSKMVVSTIKDHDTNVFLANHLREVNPDVVAIFHANNIDQATTLYDLGANYVMIPHHASSEKTSQLIKKVDGDKEALEKHRQKHLATLESHLSDG